MLPEEVDTHIHQFRGIQGGAAVEGIARCVGRNAGEGVFHLDTGGIGTYRNLVGVTGVPG